MADPKQIADNYLSTWNAPAAERTPHLAGWAEDAHYVDPLMRGQGRDGIAEMMDAAVTQFPGYRFALDGTPDGHDRYVRFSWTLNAGDGAVAARGTDVVKLDENGRIADVIGFLDGVPA